MNVVSNSIDYKFGSVSLFDFASSAESRDFQISEDFRLDLRDYNFDDIAENFNWVDNNSNIGNAPSTFYFPSYSPESYNPPSLTYSLTDINKLVVNNVAVELQKPAVPLESMTPTFTLGSPLRQTPLFATANISDLSGKPLGFTSRLSAFSDANIENAAAAYRRVGEAVFSEAFNIDQKPQLAPRFSDSGFTFQERAIVSSRPVALSDQFRLSPEAIITSDEDQSLTKDNYKGTAATAIGKVVSIPKFGNVGVFGVVDPSAVVFGALSGNLDLDDVVRSGKNSALYFGIPIQNFINAAGNAGRSFSKASAEALIIGIEQKIGRRLPDVVLPNDLFDRISSTSDALNRNPQIAVLRKGGWTIVPQLVVSVSGESLANAGANVVTGSNKPASLKVGLGVSATTPTGDTFLLNARWDTLNGKPVISGGAIKNNIPAPYVGTISSGVAFTLNRTETQGSVDTLQLPNVGTFALPRGASDLLNAFYKVTGYQDKPANDKSLPPQVPLDGGPLERLFERADPGYRPSIPEFSPRRKPEDFGKPR